MVDFIYVVEYYKKKIIESSKLLFQLFVFDLFVLVLIMKLVCDQVYWGCEKNSIM